MGASISARTRAVWMRVRGLAKRADVEAELTSHVQMHVDDGVRAGMTEGDARRAALVKLGGVEQTRQAYREQAGLPWVENGVQDLRFALRQLRSSPMFCVIAVMVLGLGLAASTAIFAFVDAALIRPLPYPEPDRLAAVTEQIALIGRANLSFPDYVDWKRMNTVFRSFDVFTGDGAMLSTAGGTVMVRGARVSDGFFKTLGVTPVMGRDFYHGEDVAGGPHNVIITYEAWQERFSGRKDIVGQPETLSGEVYTVVGVLPRTFEFPLRGHLEFWLPLQAQGECAERRSCHTLDGVARLKDGVSMEQARAQMEGIAGQLERQYPGSNRGQSASVMALSELMVGNIRPILLTLLAGSGLLLAIACINVASLLLVRSEGRRREFAVRGALGASRLRLVRQFVTEGALLVGCSAVLGAGGAYGLIGILRHLVPVQMLARMPYLQGLSVNRHCVLFALVICGASLVLFTLTPVVRIPAMRLRDGMTEGARGTAGVAWRRLGSQLVVAELAITVVLLVAAGLLGKSFYRLLRVDLNFEPEHLATLAVAFPEHTYTNDAKVAQATNQLLANVAALPGVASAAVTSVLPLSGNDNTDWIRFVGRPYDGKHIEVPMRDVSPGYFTTLHTRLLSGRFFTEQDAAGKPLVTIINKTLARKYFPDQDPIGQQFGNTELDAKSIKQIVGVIDDLKEGSLDAEIVPSVYYPIEQDTDTYFSLVVRTRQTEESLLPLLTAKIHAMDRGIGTADETSMMARIDDSQTAYLHRSSAWLVAGFAGLALLLSTVGLYGVIGYSVSQREREIGVRMALGAQRSSVYRLILGEAGRLAAWGIAAGVLCAVAATLMLRSLLFGVQSWDVGTLFAAAGVLAASAMLASYVPARRAARVQPMVALRAE